MYTYDTYGKWKEQNSGREVVKKKKNENTHNTYNNSDKKNREKKNTRVIYCNGRMCSKTFMRYSAVSVERCTLDTITVMCTAPR